MQGVNLPGKTPLQDRMLVVTVTGLQGLRFYFGDYRNGHYFEVPGNEVSYEFQRYVDPHDHLYLIGDPSMYVVFAGFDFLISSRPA